MKATKIVARCLLLASFMLRPCMSWMPSMTSHGCKVASTSFKLSAHHEFDDKRSCSEVKESSPSMGRRRFLDSVAVGSLMAVATTTLVPKESANAAPLYFTPEPHSLDGKLIVITGGTAGLGLESGKRLAMGGATVVLTSRTLEKGQAAVQAVQDYLASNNVKNDAVYAAQLDLDDLESVKSFPKQLASVIPALGADQSMKQQQIDVLMNNAGVMAIPDRRLTKDGYEKTFQSNHLGHFALTAKLFPFLAKDARIINVSSSAYMISQSGLDLDNLNGEKKYSAWGSYGNSKLENILFTKELQKRAEEAGLSQLEVVALHPGAVQTSLPRYLIGEDKFAKMEQGEISKKDLFFMQALSKFIKTVEDGASTQIYLAAGKGGDVKGKFFEEMKSHGVMGAANDMDTAGKLWDMSEKLAGVKFDLQ